MSTFHLPPDPGFRVVCGLERDVIIEQQSMHDGSLALVQVTFDRVPHLIEALQKAVDEIQVDETP